MFFEWLIDQLHEIDFVMVDSSGNEVSGLGSAFDIELRKLGGSFVAGTGTKAEIGNGWYRYTNVAGEADTIGPVAIRVTGAGAVQQNLLAVVQNLQASASGFTYTVTNSSGGSPVPNINVQITTDSARGNTIWIGLTDAFGVARDSQGNLPYLSPGTYYFWKYASGYQDDQNPDIEVVT